MHGVDGEERMIYKGYPIVPVPKPRMTQRDKRGDKRPAVARYHAFCDECRLYRVKLRVGDVIDFVLPMPKSWSKKKRNAMTGREHTQKPDLSNLLKALEDAVLEDDSHMWRYGGLSKRWGEQGAVIISHEESETGLGAGRANGGSVGTLGRASGDPGV